MNEKGIMFLIEESNYQGCFKRVNLFFMAICFNGFSIT